MTMKRHTSGRLDEPNKEPPAGLQPVLRGEESCMSLQHSKRIQQCKSPGRVDYPGHGARRSHICSEVADLAK